MWLCRHQHAPEVRTDSSSAQRRYSWISAHLFGGNGMHERLNYVRSEIEPWTGSALYLKEGLARWRGVLRFHWGELREQVPYFSGVWMKHSPRTVVSALIPAGLVRKKNDIPRMWYVISLIRIIRLLCYGLSLQSDSLSWHVRSKLRQWAILSPTLCAF